MQGVSSSKWDKVRQAHKQQSQAANAPCHLCNQPIQYGAPDGHPAAYEPDHLLPRKTHPHLALDIANLRPSHAKCNNTRQANPINDNWTQAEQWD